VSAKSSILDQLGYSHDGYGCDEVIPRGYASLMDLYENNFIRFKKLMAGLETINTTGVSHVPGCQSIYLDVIERSRYTTTVRMTYFFNDDEREFAEPDLRLRIYHDVKLVEVVAGHLRRGPQHHDHLSSTAGPSTARMSKWRLNRFLYKWLGYCLYLGHSITPEA
jgi:uncharacterized protein YqiB (DUF1249 family)